MQQRFSHYHLIYIAVSPRDERFCICDYFKKLVRTQIRHNVNSKKLFSKKKFAFLIRFSIELCPYA